MSFRPFTLPERTPPSPKRTLPRRFTTLFRSNYDFIWRCALRLGVDATDVDDVVQETFLIALRRLDEFTDEGAAQPWLFAILRNVMRNHARGQRRRSRKQQAYSTLQAQPSGDAERMLGIGLLDQFLSSLKPDLRRLFVLAELEGYDSRAAGEALGINPNTARTRLRAARKAFAAAFEDAHEVRERLDQVVRGTRKDPPQASEAARERVLRGIIAAPLELIGASVGSGLGLGAWFGKLTIAGLGTLAAIATVLAMEHAREPASVRVTPTQPLASSVQAIEPTRAHEADEPEPPLVVLASVEPAKPSQPEMPERSLTAESPESDPSPALEAMRILTDARTALIDGKAKDALRSLQTHTWPDAVLAARARGLEMVALCALDRSDEAKAIAEAHAHADHWLLDSDDKCW